MLDLQVITILKHNESTPEDWITKDLQSKAIPIDIQVILQGAITVRVIHARIGQYVGRDLQ